MLEKWFRHAFTDCFDFCKLVWFIRFPLESHYLAGKVCCTQSAIVRFINLDSAKTVSGSVFLFSFSFFFLPWIVIIYWRIKGGNEIEKSETQNKN